MGVERRFPLPTGDAFESYGLPIVPAGCPVDIGELVSSGDASSIGMTLESGVLAGAVLAGGGD
jgi:hypothetical protein